MLVDLSGAREWGRGVAVSAQNQPIIVWTMITWCFGVVNDVVVYLTGVLLDRGMLLRVIHRCWMKGRASSSRCQKQGMTFRLAPSRAHVSVLLQSAQH